MGLRFGIVCPESVVKAECLEEITKRQCTDPEEKRARGGVNRYLQLGGRGNRDRGGEGRGMIVKIPVAGHKKHTR